MIQDTIYVLDFGSQYSHLITRRIRELGVYAELVPVDFPFDKLKQAKGIVLSGGPQSLRNKTALRTSKAIFELGIPVLGICYGLQLIAHDLGGQVRKAKKREYGAAQITVTKPGKLFKGLPRTQQTWMSHQDQVVKLPHGFTATASSPNCRYVAIADESRNIFGLQFHPEVMHTAYGRDMIRNFIRLTKAKRAWTMKGFVQKTTRHIQQQVGNDKVVCALSGGVDSSVAATLVHEAIGPQLHCIFVDTGLLRKNEVKQVVRTFRSYQKMNLIVIDAKDEFLRKLQRISDPEKKRKQIGNLFIRIFEREAKKIGGVKWLMQGTLYTDVITSGISVGKSAAVIKSHHNVGGLPKKFGFKLIEPFRELYKDEVRKVGRLLGLPKEVTERQPFPGPGLAVRIIGQVTEDKLEIVRQADWIVREEIERVGLAKKIQQYYAALPTIRSVGVQGDGRTYGFPIIVRAVTTRDFMTADWARIPHDVLARISNRITNEVVAVNRVVYDITSKPPGTVEWE